MLARHRRSTASAWLEAASGDEMLAATEVADLLVRKGVPFREAHGIVGGLVRDAVEQRQARSRSSRRRSCARTPSTSTSPLRGLCSGGWLESKRIEGGTALGRVREQLELARGLLDG